jgi:hypothetical protein
MSANMYVLWFVLTIVMTVTVIGLGTAEASGVHLRDVFHRLRHHGQQH